jgi:predicted transposase/invertase (TIGR01784 family)
MGGTVIETESERLIRKGQIAGKKESAMSKETTISSEELEQLKITIPPEEQWENLGISNDFIFAKVMEDPDLCKAFLECLLGIKIDHVEYPETQKAIHISKDQKSVRLDVYVEDENHTIYNIEMQVVKKRHLPKRSRYYQGMIDLNLLRKGADYDELNKSLVIFICTFDYFEKGRHRYEFQNLCIDDPGIALGDETTKIFFNTKGTLDDVSEEAEKVLSFIDGNQPTDEFTSNLAEKVKEVKENKEWEVAYMTLMMREREKYKDGREEGIQLGANGIISTLLDLNYSNEEIISTLQKKLNITEFQASEYLEQYYANNL